MREGGNSNSRLGKVLVGLAGVFAAEQAYVHHTKSDKPDVVAVTPKPGEREEDARPIFNFNRPTENAIVENATRGGSVEQQMKPEELTAAIELINSGEPEKVLSWLRDHFKGKLKFGIKETDKWDSEPGIVPDYFITVSVEGSETTAHDIFVLKMLPKNDQEDAINLYTVEAGTATNGVAFEASTTTLSPSHLLNVLEAKASPEFRYEYDVYVNGSQSEEEKKQAAAYLKQHGFEIAFESGTPAPTQGYADTSDLNTPLDTHVDSAPDEDVTDPFETPITPDDNHGESTDNNNSK